MSVIVGENGSNKSDWRAHGGDRGTDLADR